MTKKVLLAVGRKDYASILRDVFSKEHEHFTVLNEEVVHRRFLYEIIDTNKPDIILLHDKNVVSDLTEQASKDEEILQFILKMRLDHDDSIRFVILCERPDDDPFLSRLANLGIFDIFNSNSIPINTLLEQLMNKPKFSNVEKYINLAEKLIPYTMLKPEKKDEEENEEDSHTSKKNSQQKEKPVVQKVINKNIIKRDYHIQVHNHAEKIVGVPVNKKLVLVGSPLKRSGSTFISHLLARSIAKLGISTTYIESPFAKPYTFDRFMGNHLTEPYRSKFYQFSQHDELMDYTTNWDQDGVNIICKHPVNEPVYKNQDITFEVFMKVLFQSNSTVTIVDVGTDWNHELFKDVMDIADYTYYVMEPDLPFIQSFEESKKEEISFIREKLASPNTALIGNHFDKSILENELIKELYSDDLISVFPTFSPADIFKAHYNGKFLNDISDYETRIKESVSPLLAELLPEEFLKKQNKRTGLFKNMLHKKISFQRTETKGEINI